MTAPPASQPRQRWQIRFSRTGPALQLTQQRLIEEFERAFREAQLPLSETSGQRRRPRLSLAASLPAGVDAHGEVLEAHFDELIPAERLRAAGELLPEGVQIVEARDVWHGFPSAASMLRGAEYEVRVRGDEPLTDEALRGSIVRLLAATRLPGSRRRGPTERRADAGERDLRPLIQDIEVVEVDDGGGGALLRMVLRVDRAAATRPEDVVAAMDLPLRVVSVVRRRLVFVDTLPVAR